MQALTGELNQEEIEAKQGLAYGSFGGMLVLAMGHLGVRLGLFEALEDAGPLSSEEVSQRTGMRERFVREWLYEQAAAGVLDHRGDGKFELSDEAAMVFADRDNPASFVAILEELPELFAVMTRAEQGFRTGLGNSYDDFGPRVARMMDAAFGAWNRTALVSEALPKISGLTEKLAAGARVADLGCGGGAAPLAIGQAFPASHIDGYENSLHALALAGENLTASGLSNVRFLNNDQKHLPSEPTYDLVLTLDCLHDMPRPDLAAAAIRKAIKPDGVWFIADIDGASTAEANLEHPMGALLLGMSVTLCLQSGGSTPDGIALGTLGLPEPKMRELVTAAGFSHFGRVQGLQHPVNAYYEVRP